MICVKTDMERMPDQCCFQCPFVYFHDDYSVCSANKKSLMAQRWGGEKRPDWCPLVEVEDEQRP